MGCDFVQGEYKRFQEAGDEKLASRYHHLLQYYLAKVEAERKTESGVSGAARLRCHPSNFFSSDGRSRAGSLRRAEINIPNSSLAATISGNQRRLVFPLFPTGSTER